MTEHNIKKLKDVTIGEMYNYCKSGASKSCYGCDFSDVCHGTIDDLSDSTLELKAKID